MSFISVSCSPEKKSLRQPPPIQANIPSDFKSFKIKFAKKLIDNPEMIKDLGEKLYETVKDKYNLNNVTKNRYEIYKNLMK